METSKSSRYIDGLSPEDLAGIVELVDSGKTEKDVAEFYNLAYSALVGRVVSEHRRHNGGRHNPAVSDEVKKKIEEDLRTNRFTNAALQQRHLVSSSTIGTVRNLLGLLPVGRRVRPEAPLTKQAVEEEIHEAELRLANLKAKCAAMAIRVEVTGDGIIEVHGASPSFTKLGGMARFCKVLEQSFGPQERLEGQSLRERAVNLAMAIFHVTKEEVLDRTSDLEKIEEALNRFM